MHTTPRMNAEYYSFTCRTFIVQKLSVDGDGVWEFPHLGRLAGVLDSLGHYYYYCP